MDAAISWLFTAGHVVDLVLGVLLVEAVVLLATRRARLLAFVAAGACLALALRVALTGGWWGWIGLALAGGGVAHAADLAVRWRAAPAQPNTSRGESR